MGSIGDKELTYVILNEHKHCAASLTNLVLESANQNLRNDAEKILNRTFRHQKQLFDMMSQKGWYSVQNASPMEMNTAKQEVSKIQANATMM